jgi:hypothetical protein
MMIRRKIGHLIVAPAFVLAIIGGGSTPALASADITSADTIAADVQATELVDTAPAADVDTDEDEDVDEDEDADVDDAQVANVDQPDAGNVTLEAGDGASADSEANS